MALMGGKALTATELALEANVMPPTASSHLAKLVEGQLLVVRKQGRHRYFQLQSIQIAEFIETLLNLSSSLKRPGISTGPSDPELRNARVCYDHLAGQLGVSLYDALVFQTFIREDNQDAHLTEFGEAFFKKIGADIPQMKAAKRPVCKSCLDWSERRNHIAGALGQWILRDIIKQGWASQPLNSRALHFSKNGRYQFNRRYGIQS